MQSRENVFSLKNKVVEVKYLNIIIITNQIIWNHFFDRASSNGVRPDPDHGDVEGRKDGKGAGDAGLLPPVGDRVRSEEGGLIFRFWHLRKLFFQISSILLHNILGKLCSIK